MTNKQIVMELHSKGLTNLEIINISGLSKTQISAVLQKAKLKSNRQSSINIDNNLTQFMLGSILGDGCISRLEDKRSSRIGFGHGLKQKDYIQWKLDFLKKYNLAPEKLGSYTSYSSRYKSGECTSLVFKSKSHKYFNDFRRDYYPNDKKQVDNQSLMQLDAFGLAIWYMDDGCICKRSYQIYTNGFTLPEIVFLQNLLKVNFNIDTTVDKNRTLYIRTSSKTHFENLIKPYIIPSMTYKLRGSV